MQSHVHVHVCPLNTFLLHVYAIMCVHVTVLLTLLILIAEGAPGNPGMHVLNAATSENGPRPHELRPHTRNL